MQCGCFDFCHSYDQDDSIGPFDLVFEYTIKQSGIWKLKSGKFCRSGGTEILSTAPDVISWCGRDLAQKALMEIWWVQQRDEHIVAHVDDGKESYTGTIKQLNDRMDQVDHAGVAKKDGAIQDEDEDGGWGQSAKRVLKKYFV